MLHFLKKNKHHIKWLSVLSAFFLVFIGALVGSYLFFENKYQNTIYPGVFLGKNNLSGLSKEEATLLINKKVDHIKQEGIIFYYLTDQATLHPLISSVEGDLAYQIIDFDVEKSIQKAFNYGRNENFFNNFIQKFVALTYEYTIPMEYSIYEPEITRFLSDNFSRFESPAINAKLIYKNDEENNLITFDIEEEKYGQVINNTKALNELQHRLANLNFEQIELEAEINHPEILKKDILNIDTKTKNIYYKAPITLKYKLKNWVIYRNNILEWLELKKNIEKENLEKESDDNELVYVGLNTEKLTKYLEENISKKINQELVDSKFEIKNGKVVEFQASREGIMLDLEATAKKIEYNLTSGNEKEFEVITEIKTPMSEDEIEGLGIKEIIGTGHSNFSGSPKSKPEPLPSTDH